MQHTAGGAAVTKVGKYAQQYGPEIAADYANIKWAEILRDGRRLLVIMQWGRGVRVVKRRRRK